MRPSSSSAMLAGASRRGVATHGTLATIAIVATTIASCTPSSLAPSTAHDTPGRETGSRTAWVVIAPHPDDETLIASATLLRAVQAHGRVAVIVMTNGDLDCLHDGLVREGETIAGLAAVGVSETDVYFLGYPDGGLASLGLAPLPLRKRLIDGACVLGNTTYGKRGAGGGDVHAVRFGAPGVYTSEGVVSDLAAVLAKLRPENVVLTHAEDTHPDHASTYAIFRRALDRLPEAPRVHRAVVHNGDCWPTGTAPREPCPAPLLDADQPTPPLSGRLAGYVPRERLPVPAACLVRDPATNPKLRAIGAHASQTRATLASYLFAFAKSDEVFFPETLERDGHAWRRAPRSAYAVTAKQLARPTANDTAPSLVLDEYTLIIDAERAEAKLFSGASLWRVWPLPHDLWRASALESFELRAEPRPDDGPVTEVSLYVRSGLVAVAVAISAFPSARPAR